MNKKSDEKDIAKYGKAQGTVLLKNYYQILVEPKIYLS